jgi:Arc/MetJ-type ribon-helix-helix transcriptional regulator
METEKITINLGAVDLGQIDLLVDQGFYSNRTDLIRTAIRNQLALHAKDINGIKPSAALALDVEDDEEIEEKKSKQAGWKTHFPQQAF